MKAFKLPFGMKDGALVRVSEVVSGLACGCSCPGCGGVLVARKGMKVEHHFAHHGVDDCGGGLESALHLAAKAAFETAGFIALPAVLLKPGANGSGRVLAEAAVYPIDSVRLEKRVARFVPDVIVEIRGHELLVEVFVTHRVDAVKARRVADAGCSMIEVDLSDLPRDLPAELIEDRVIKGLDGKRWVYNRHADETYRHLLSTSQRKPVVERRLALHVDYCPIRARVWRGKPYANFLDDCANCDHCLAVAPSNRYIQCGGHHAASGGS